MRSAISASGSRRTQANDMALLRSAELTLPRGCTHLAVIGGTDHVQVSHGMTPSTTSVTGHQQLGNAVDATTTARSGTATTLSMPTAPTRGSCTAGGPLPLRRWCWTHARSSSS
jgi:hypothetical protein